MLELPSALSEYLTGFWGLTFNVFVVAAAGAWAYNRYARSWPALTGRHTAVGRITWSATEVSQGARSMTRALVSYAFTVDGTLFNGQIPWHLLDRRYERGEEVTVFYSPKDPNYSFVLRRPTPLTLFFDCSGRALGVMTACNIPSFFIWWLVSIQ